MKNLNQDNIERIKQFVESYSEEHFRSPSVREIEAFTGIPRATVHKYLSRMRDSGEISYDGFRNVKTGKMQKMEQTATVTVALVGSIKCGLPAFAEENIEGYIKLPETMVGKGEFFMLKAEGDSMIDAEIGDGDIVLVRKQQTAEVGEIVVALIGDETTLKRYYPEPQNQRIRLHPENKFLKDFYVSDLQIQGVAKSVLKELY